MEKDTDDPGEAQEEGQVGGKKQRYAETITRSRAPQSIDTEGDRWWFLGSLDHLPEDVEFVSGD